MNKLLLKISVNIYVFIKIILGFIAPIGTGFIAFKIVNPNNFLGAILFIVVWFASALIVLLIGKYLHGEIRYRFKKIDDYLYEIESYIENQKYK